MNHLQQFFDERLKEVDAYLDFLESLELLVRSGQPKVGERQITALQQKVLNSSFFLQLYNLTEATANWCLNEVALRAESQYHAGDLTAQLRREWIRVVAQTHEDLNVENRFNQTIAVCERILDQKPIEPWEIEKGGGGNWDDGQFKAIAERLGVDMRIRKNTYRNIRRPLLQDKGPLEFIRHIRNKLAHGSISFAESAGTIGVADLKKLKKYIVNYLQEVITAFERYIDGHEYLTPAKRPAP